MFFTISLCSMVLSYLRKYFELMLFKGKRNYLALAEEIGFRNTKFNLKKVCFRETVKMIVSDVDF